jgi:hypothetical protein
MSQQTKTTPAVGDAVGTGRWPYSGGGLYGRPWRGELLAANDPRAWQGTLAFGFREGLPGQDEVDRHVAWCRANVRGAFDDAAPVLWDFGTYRRVWWESAAKVVPFADDLAAWEAADAAERARQEASRPAGSRLFVA